MSVEAYAIAVKISLINQVSAGLMQISKHFVQTGADAKLLEQKMKDIKLLMAGGMAFAGTGAAMLYALKGPVEQAIEYQRQIAKLRQQGLGDDQIADARKFVEATAIMGTSMQDRMKLFAEAQGGFREAGVGGLDALSAAKTMLPVLAKYQVASGMLAGPNKDAVEGSMISMIKTIEIMGGIGNTQRASDIAAAVFKAVASSGGMVDEKQLKQFVAYASSAGNQQSLRTIFGGLEPTMGEFGGSAVAVGLRTAYGRVNGMMSLPPHVLLHRMQQLHMLDATGRQQTGDLAKLEATDVIGYALELMKRYDAGGIKSQVDREHANADLFGTNGAKIFNKIMSQMPTIHRAAMQAFGRAESQKHVPEAAKLLNSAARLLSVFQQGAIALQRIRTNGNQTMTVQHVHVEAGGQALVGNVTTGGGNGRA